jgi:hypothetical protein
MSISVAFGPKMKKTTSSIDLGFGFEFSCSLEGTLVPS